MQTCRPLRACAWPRCGNSTGTAAAATARKSRRFNSRMASIVLGSDSMFERYTERARRVLFFARYEASQLGSLSIEPEHLLLGLLREGKGLTGRLFARAHITLEHIRQEIERQVTFAEKVSTSVEI